MKNLCLLVCVAVTFIFHCFVQSLIVAPITGTIVLMCFHLLDKPEWMEKLFLLLGKHSTNIWLIHMFFYLVLFKNLIFRLKEPVFIFVGMIILCMGVSVLINQIEKVIIMFLHTLKKVQ